jgi:ABC-type Na+ transport system ATPase subunit NatA
MALLVWIKTLATVYDSPPIALYCGQTIPWNYAATSDDIMADAQCVVPPDTCDPPQGMRKYYQTEVNLTMYDEEAPVYYANYGYIASAFGQQYPLYGLTVGDEASIYGYNPLTYPLQLNNPSPSFVGLMRFLASCDKAAGCDSAKVAVLPKTAQADLAAAAKDLHQYLSNQLDHYGAETANLVAYDDEASLEAVLTAYDYDLPENFAQKVAFAIVLNGLDADNHVYDYSIRTNYTFPWETRFDTVSCLNGIGDWDCTVPTSASSAGTQEFFTMPSTDTFVDEISRPSLSSYYYGYAYTGFMTMQKVTDEYFLSLGKSGGDKDKKVRDSGIPIVYTNVSMSLFPQPAYEANNFQQTIASLLPIFYMLAFLYPFSRMIRNLVLEKEMKIKEGMKIMGLSGTVYAMSWLITLGVQLLIMCLLILLTVRGSVFEFSDDLPVFLYFFIFSLSVINLAFLLATFFSHSKTAAIMGTLLFFATYFPFYAVTDPALNPFWKILTSLFSPTAFALGAGVLADLETGQIGINAGSMFTVVGNYTFFNCLFMLSLDTILYGLLASYFDKILPTEYGTQLPWYYPITSVRDLFCGAPSPSGSDAEEPLLNDLSFVGTNVGAKEEPVSADLSSQINEDRSLSIRNLRKVFQTTGEDRVAVDKLNLDLYEGQITVLLGHNGAGKSTTISMLTGLINATSGDAIVKGKRITESMPEIRNSMGVCPQHDVLFADLTVAQHLRMFAVFKGVSSSRIEAEVKKIINEVGLNEKKDVASKQLSGGMKRKLSLGIALIGDSKVVVLDEPTSGMDPYSRRSTWNILQKNKAGRIILLTTHFMDEVRGPA